MAWWRHDPSVWARSPARRYAERVLRDHEATLRTRSCSRTPLSTARPQGLDSVTRPEGMTDQEWSQLQRYRKWKKMLKEHPYRGLFGASEDMLRGKGLTDWEWVYKTFPKWMSQETDPQEPNGGKISLPLLRVGLTACRAQTWRHFQAGDSRRRTAFRPT
jgi:hypothetical protein